MRPSALLTLLYAGSLASAGALAADPATHCRADETVVFQCSPGRKLLSICAMPGRPGASYRYGAPGAPELVLPDPAAPDATALSANTLTFAGGGGAFLRFRRADYSYTVYTALSRGSGEKAGLVVTLAGKRIAAMRCRGAVQSVLGPDWFYAAKIAADGDGFDLP